LSCVALPCRFFLGSLTYHQCTLASPRPSLLALLAIQTSLSVPLHLTVRNTERCSYPNHVAIVLTRQKSLAPHSNTVFLRRYRRITFVISFPRYSLSSPFPTLGVWFPQN
jgi:hypothetical protein